jgi:LSD1 subclass zinc finger protein
MTASATIFVDCTGCGERLVLGVGDRNITCPTCYRITLRRQVQTATPSQKGEK